MYCRRNSEFVTFGITKHIYTNSRPSAATSIAQNNSLRSNLFLKLRTPQYYFLNSNSNKKSNCVLINIKMNEAIDLKSRSYFKFLIMWHLKINKFEFIFTVSNWIWNSINLIVITVYVNRIWNFPNLNFISIYLSRELNVTFYLSLSFTNNLLITLTTYY